MSNDDPIRRGDVKDAMTKNGFGGSQMDAAIEAIPAAPLDALTLERAARMVLNALNDAGDHPTAGAMRRVFSDLADTIRALAPEPAHVTAARVVKIKPLVWEFEQEDVQVANTSARHQYRIVFDHRATVGAWMWFCDGRWICCETEDEAKAAAQADYEARIRSAIVEAGE